MGVSGKIANSMIIDLGSLLLSATKRHRLRVADVTKTCEVSDITQTGG